jgi:ATP-dependent exoDNAse (exonuclease V) beta subunit
MAYEGGIELFRSDPAKLLLAWLRILESNADRGWAVVLEKAGYTLDEIQYILKHEAYPSNMQAFRSELAALSSLGSVAHSVFSQYGYDGAYADVLLTTMQSIHDTTTLTRGDLIQFIERGIETGSTHEVHASASVNSVTIRTIHATKGLEHPIVIVANMNSRRFPPSGGNSNAITFDDRIGLRQRRVYSDSYGYPHLHDNWQADVLRKCLPRGYDEERRLLYVTMTRAKSHLIFSAGEKPNTFLQELPIDVEEYAPDIRSDGANETTQSHLDVSVPTPDGPVNQSPHSLMRDDVFENVDGGRGTEFGTQVHEFAEQYALGEPVEPTTADERQVKEFINSLDGELHVEEEVYLPLTVGSRRVTIAGVIDLVHVLAETVEIFDYKTDRGRHAESEYRKQLSVYHHVLSEWFPTRDVRAAVLYTAQGTPIDIEPLSRAELSELMSEKSVQSPFSVEGHSE